MNTKKSLLTLSEPWGQPVSMEGEIMHENGALIFISKNKRKFIIYPRYKDVSNNNILEQGNQIVNIEEVDMETNSLMDFEAIGSIRIL